MKSLGGTAIWTAFSTAIKIAVGLLLVKLFALQFGATGLGQAANFMTLITVLGVFAGAGIFNGVTKYVAEYEDNKVKLSILFATSSTIILIFSTVLALFFIVFAQPISEFLFYTDRYVAVVVATGICQFGIALSNYYLAVLKGFRNAKANAISIILGTLLGFIAFIIGLYQFDYSGALVGLVLIPALSFPISAYFLKKSAIQAVCFQKNFANFSTAQSKKLLKFSAMVFITAMTLPTAYILLRDLLVKYHSIEAVGLWQGMSKISDAYLQFITTVFSVYLLPTFSKLTEKRALQQELWKVVKVVAVAVVVISSVIFLLRHWIILLLYSEAFLPIKVLFQWQLLGDIFKVLAYIFGYLIVAKATLKWYILAELFQFGLLTGLGYWLIPDKGALGATQAYFITYLSYFVVCIIGFNLYQKR